MVADASQIHYGPASGLHKEKVQIFKIWNQHIFSRMNNSKPRPKHPSKPLQSESKKHELHKSEAGQGQLTLEDVTRNILKLNTNLSFSRIQGLPCFHDERHPCRIETNLLKSDYKYSVKIHKCQNIISSYTQHSTELNLHTIPTFIVDAQNKLSKRRGYRVLRYSWVIFVAIVLPNNHIFIPNRLNSF